MKKISEMSLEECREYAQQLENNAQADKSAIEEKDKNIEELKGLNLDLQKRNKELFLKVEQQGDTPPVADTKPAKEDPKVKSLDDLAKDLAKKYL